jgi:hypothetical protein
MPSATPHLASLSTIVVAILLGLSGVAVACTDPTERRPRAARPPAPASSSPSAAREPTCPPIAEASVTGKVRDPALDEISGIAVGHRMQDVLWVQEDSGNAAVVFALEATGRVVAEVTLEGATNQDWEDLAWADGRLWAGDIGDNARERSEIQVYSFPEPRDPSVTSVDATVHRLRYEDGPRDAEAMFVDSFNETLFVIEKQLASQSAVYAVPLGGLRPGAVGVLQQVASIPMSTVTAADIGPAGIAVSNYLVTQVFPWTDDRSVVSAFGGISCLAATGFSEALAQTSDGTGMYSIPEGTRPPIRYVVTPVATTS